MRTSYNKLIRDNIPAIIERRGGTCGIETLSETAYREALREKLLEEAREAAEACTDELVTELADVYEVVDALMAASGISHENVHAVQCQRHAERGGFTQRLRLLWTR